MIYKISEKRALTFKAVSLKAFKALTFKSSFKSLIVARLAKYMANQRRKL